MIWIWGCSFWIIVATWRASIHLRESRPWEPLPMEIWSTKLLALSSPKAATKAFLTKSEEPRPILECLVILVRKVLCTALTLSWLKSSTSAIRIPNFWTCLGCKLRKRVAASSSDKDNIKIAALSIPDSFSKAIFSSSDSSKPLVDDGTG